jgi:hypothetical protein
MGVEKMGGGGGGVGLVGVHLYLDCVYVIRLMLAVRNSVRRQSYTAYLVRYSRPQQRSVRRFSTSNLDPTIREFARTLVQKQPCVAMSSDDVNVLSEPKEFYQLLLVGVLELFVGIKSHSGLGHGSSCTKANLSVFVVHWFGRG